MMLGIICYRKGLRIETILVPLPQKYESEAIEPIELLAPKSQSRLPKRKLISIVVNQSYSFLTDCDRMFGKAEQIFNS